MLENINEDFYPKEPPRQHPLYDRTQDGSIHQSGHHPEWEHPESEKLADRLSEAFDQIPNYFIQRGMASFKAGSLTIEFDRKRAGIGTGYKNRETYIDGDVGVFFKFCRRSRSTTWSKHS